MNDTSQAGLSLGAKQGLGVLCGKFDDGLQPEEWVQNAVRNVVVNSAPASIRSARSALRWYARFADEALGANGTHFPPSPEGLAAWSLLFKRADTYSNYIGYLRLGCDIMGLNTSPLNHMLVKRAKETNTTAHTEIHAGKSSYFT